MKKLFTLALACLGTGLVQAQNIYGDMETWLTYMADTATLERPQGWNGSDSVGYTIMFPGIDPAKQIFQDSHAHGGSYSAKIVTADLNLAVVSGVLTNGKIDVDVLGQTVEISGGTAVTDRIAYLTGWFDYQPQGADECMLQIQAFLSGQGVGGADSLVGEGYFNSDGTSGFENFFIPLTYVDANVVPDKVLIGFSSSADLLNGIDGSTLYIDDVTMTTASVAAAPSARKMKCYPNPASDVLHLRVADNEMVQVSLSSITGQTLIEQSFRSGLDLDVSGLANGLYYYSVRNASGSVISQDKLVISK